MKFIDAHHHLWDLSACSYPWLEARGVVRFFGDPTPIQKNYLLDDFLAESAIYRPAKSVHIQVGVSPGDELKESQWIAQSASKPEALVGFVDLAAEEVSERLAEQSAIERVKGVRQIVGRHPDEDKALGTDALIDSPRFARGLAALEDAGLSFDLQLIPPQHARMAQLLARFESLPVVVCHAGSPWDQSNSGLDDWARGMASLAERPNTYVKISGLGMFNRDWTTEQLAPIVHRVIDLFGPKRVMAGSNFPVDKLYHSYDVWWHAIDTLFERYSTAERELMLFGNAEVFYRI